MVPTVMSYRRFIQRQMLIKAIYLNRKFIQQIEQGL